MTTEQKNTIDVITNQIERANGKVSVKHYEIRGGRVALSIFTTIDRTDWIRTETYCDVEINAKGMVVKGFWDKLTPKVETIYPYM